MSPYVYCSDNPMNRIDPDGRLDAPLYGTQVYKMHNLVSVDLDHKYRAQGGSLGNDPSITYSYAFRSVGINAKNSSQLAAEKNGTLITVNSEFFKIRNVGSSPHVGTDYLAKYGSNVYSYGDGSIVSTGENSAGKFVTVKYGNGDVVNFMHLSETGSFKVGENIYEGQILGQSGTYGGGPHLHVSAVNSSGELIDVTSRNYGTVSNSEFFTTYGGDYLNLKAAKEANQNISPMLAPPNITQQQDNTKLKNNSMGGW
ncbi:MAG TPA: M23 family metallopeptidase [Nostocaceae cyanobacterium]|nr:M23 family metallopeptidase [Nostocaceae cyanobacterium]